MNFLKAFFDTAMLSPHGICLLWRPGLLWTHAISDFIIGCAYFSIPLVLGVFLHHRRDIRFSWAVWMFVGFILLCGVTHFMMIWTLWFPIYGIEALVKAATATVSVVTAVALWPLLPKAIALPSSTSLEARIAERDLAVAELRTAMASMVEMREHEARQKLLLDELNHRVKNTLATVQALASQTLANAHDLDSFQDRFEQRLQALSGAHDLLVKGAWRDAALADLVHATLDHHGRKYTLQGPDLVLDPNFTVSLGLALNELATNAIKHGAWSQDGFVTIQLERLSDETARLVWQESGGPVAQTPVTTGFGVRLLSRGVPRELGGKAELTYPTEGFRYVLEIPTGKRVKFLDTASA